MSAARFIVGIDLGTTNSALAYLDTGQSDVATPTPMIIAQVVHPGAV